MLRTNLSSNFYLVFINIHIISISIQLGNIKLYSVRHTLLKPLSTHKNPDAVTHQGFIPILTCRINQGNLSARSVCLLISVLWCVYLACIPALLMGVNIQSSGKYKCKSGHRKHNMKGRVVSKPCRRASVRFR